MLTHYYWNPVEIPRIKEKLQLRAPDAMWDCISHRYQSPQRRYHTLQHIEEMAEHLVDVYAPNQIPSVVSLACLFHDIVYEPGISGNEEYSAKVAMEWCGPDQEQQVTDLIMANRKTVTSEQEPFLDADWAILGASPKRFAEYQKQIEQEFGHFPGFWKGRRAFLRRMFFTERIFLTQYFYCRYEAQAKKNLFGQVS